MDQTKQPDAVIDRLVELSTRLTNSKDISLIDDTVGVIGYLIRRAGGLEQTITELREELVSREQKFSELIRGYDELLERQKMAVDIILFGSK